MKPPEYNPHWPDDVQRVYRHDMEEIWDRTIAPHIWNSYHNQLDLYETIAGKEELLDILDVGCAQATLALRLAESGHRVTAVDLRQGFIDYAKSRYTHGEIEFICGNAMELDFEKSFDLIFANQLVEHLVYPESLVEHLLEHLKPRGRLVLSTPNGAYIRNTLPSYKKLGDPKRWEHKQFSADGDGHFFAYRERELAEICERAGMAGVQSRIFETPWISGHMKLHYLHRLVPTFVWRVLDKLTLAIPVLGKRVGHQLLVVGCKKDD